MPDLTTYTPEELEVLPQTTTVFDQPLLDFDKHTWVQQGYMIYDKCGTCMEQGIPIPSGKTLIKTGGHYDLVDEGK